MVVSRAASIHPPPAIREVRPAPQRVPELPALGITQRFGASAPLRVTVHYQPVVSPRRAAPRYLRSQTEDVAARAAGTAAVRRVRFEIPPKPPPSLPATGGAAYGRPVQVAGVDSWLRSRAGISCADTPLSGRPVATPRAHDTSRYRRGTLPPTAHSSPPSAGAGPAATLLKAARDADEGALCEHLRRASRVGIPESEFNCVDSSGRTPVSYIASNGSLSTLEALLQFQGVDINKEDNEGNTPLHFVAQAGHVEIMNYILSRCTGVEVDARNNLGFTPLMKAALQGRTKCAKLLLFAGASPTLRDTGRGLRAEQWARFCGRYVCAEVIEKFARHRLLERTTAYGRWGSEPELGARLLMGGKLPQNNQSSSHMSGFKSKLRRAFRTNSSGAATDSAAHRQQFSLVTQLTTAALCVSTPVLPTPNVPPVVKSLIRPLTVPKLQVTLAGSGEGTAQQGTAQTEQQPSGGSNTSPQVRDRPPTARPTAVRHKKKK